MRGVRFTKGELAWLRTWLPVNRQADLDNADHKAVKAADSVMAKLEKAQEPAGVDVAPIEAALVKAAMGKVVELEGGHARASIQAKNVGATPELAKLVGEWMARTHWLHGPMTLIDVLNKWHQWLPKARATEPPPSLQPGLNAETGPGTPTKRPAAQGRRQKAGFR
jgi:hypothetical protein